MTRLLVFVDSERPDPYLNGVVHNLRSGSISLITFIHVFGFPGDASVQPNPGRAKRTLASVLQGITSLAQRAEYSYPDGRTVALDEQNSGVPPSSVKAFYTHVDNMAVRCESMDIHYRDLRKFLKKINQTEKEYIVDVTGFKKRFFGDFVALGLVDNLKNIRTFDLLVETNFEAPWKVLLHELAMTSAPAYDYVDIMETRIMADCSRAVFIRAPRLRYASMFAITLAAIGICLNWYFGLESEQAKWVNVLAQFATFSALFFIFFPPRDA